MPLVIAPLNVELTIIKILANEVVKKHLSNLGIIIDSKITILSSNGGNLIVKVHDGRITLDRDLATKIVVKN